MDAQDSRCWWEARRWPEHHPTRVRSRRGDEASSGYEAVGVSARAGVDGAFRRGEALHDPDEAVVAGRCCRSVLQPAIDRDLPMWPI
jgi:hypothetical protein